MKNKVVAILESRAGEQMADLVRKYGGIPFLAPALAEVPDLDPAHIRQLMQGWSTTPPEIFIFQTGVGTRALFDATDSLGLTQRLHQLLEACRVVVRGPKPTAVLFQNGQVQEDPQWSDGVDQDQRLQHGEGLSRRPCHALEFPWPLSHSLSGLEVLQSHPVSRESY